MSCDPMRTGLGLVQWLAADRMKETVEHLCGWMRGRGRTVRGNFAAAAAGMLLCQHSERMLPVGAAGTVPAGEAPSPDLLLPLLDLAPALARYRSKQGIETFLKAAHRWARDKAWAARLSRHPVWFRLVDNAPFSLREHIHEWVDALATKPIEALGEKRVPAPVLALHLRLRCALRLRATRNVALRDSVLVLWHESGHPRSRQRLGTLAWQLYRLTWPAPRQREGDLPPFVFFRVGSHDPVAVSGDASRAEETDFTAPLAAPGILSPLLETLAAAAGQVLLLADGPLLDAEDWLEPDGLFVNQVIRDRLKLFWDNRSLQQPHLAGDGDWQPHWISLSAMNDSQAMECVRASIAMDLSHHNP